MGKNQSIPIFVKVCRYANSGENGVTLKVLMDNPSNKNLCTIYNHWSQLLDSKTVCRVFKENGSESTNVYVAVSEKLKSWDWLIENIQGLTNPLPDSLPIRSAIMLIMARDCLNALRELDQLSIVHCDI